MQKKKVIFVTDGDNAARQAVEIASKNIGGRCISLSAGNPTWLSAQEIAEQVMKAEHDPVVVMFDDNGNKKQGHGEKVIKTLSVEPGIEILGVAAVASETQTKSGIEVTFSIDRYGEKVLTGVDKLGFSTGDSRIFGDTISVLNEIDVPIIVGLGDPGKMDGLDDPQKGAPITTLALKEIIDSQKP